VVVVVEEEEEERKRKRLPAGVVNGCVKDCVIESIAASSMS